MKIFQKISFFIFLFLFLFHTFLPHNHRIGEITEAQENKTILAQIFDLFINTIQLDLGDHHLEKIKTSEKNTSAIQLFLYFDDTKIISLKIPESILPFVQPSCLIFFPIRKIYLHTFNYRGPTI
jgi:hypothetical protein